MEKERIVVYDYVSCNNDWKNHQFTYVGLQKTINDSLHLLLAKQLIVCKINQNENISNLTIKDIEMLWIMQEAIENKSLFDFFADIN